MVFGAFTQHSGQEYKDRLDNHHAIYIYRAFAHVHARGWDVFRALTVLPDRGAYTGRGQSSQSPRWAQKPLIPVCKHTPRFGSDFFRGFPGGG